MDTDVTTPSTTSDGDVPKKYIRTFEGDVRTIQEGGTPDLVPLRPAVASSEGGLVKPTPLKTYAGDFSDRIKERNASFATVLAAEQDSAPSVVEKEKPKFSRSGILYTIAGSLLLIAGITGAYIAYTRYLAAFAPVEPAPVASAPIFVDEREQISGDGQALARAIEQSAARLLSAGNVRLLYLASSTDSMSSPQAVDTNVFAALRTSAPNVLLRNIHTESSMAGIVSAGGGQNPFFILSVASYGDTFVGMLSWETAMPRDLEALFPSYPQTSVSTTTIATSTPLTKRIFHDEVISNHDVRIYRDISGRSIVLYGYWNQATLVIARDPAAFTEILQRLSTSRTKP